MLKAAPLVAVTVGLLAYFAYLFSEVELTSLRKDWNERRCEPLAMIVAKMVPDPKDTTIDPDAFASENFQFCMGKFIESSLGLFMAPVYKVFSNQVESVGPIQGLLQSLQSAAAKFKEPVSKMTKNLWNTFQVALFQMARVYRNIYNLFDRVFGISIATTFLGMAMFKSIQNSMAFVVKVVIIILTILVIITYFFFWFLFPVLPIILTMIGVLSASVYAANVSGMSDSFCVAPETKVLMGDGSWKCVKEIVPGDSLGGDCGIVEGVLRTVGVSWKSLVRIRGNLISRTHLVLDPSQGGDWVFADKHSEAKTLDHSEEVPSELFCLNTSSRVWIVEGGLRLRDWEELPDGFDEDWESLIYNTLNPRGLGATRTQAPGRGLLGPSAQILLRNGQTVRASEVRVGDYVQDIDSSFTRVLGVYSGLSEYGERIADDWVSSSSWIYSRNEKGEFEWIHPPPLAQKGVASPDGFSKGVHLITESGTLKLWSCLGVRDFTEVGIFHLSETAPFVTAALSGKSF